MSQTTLAERQQAFRDELLATKILVASSVAGLYGRSHTFERIVDGIDRLVTDRGDDLNATVLRFPPMFGQDVFDRTDYIASFPDLTGGISGFLGGNREHAELLAAREQGEDWSGRLQPTGVMLVSAACHPIYPTLTGELPAGGVYFDVLGQCFRREPSIDPARMQSFRQREYVYVGEAEGAVAHREEWVRRGVRLMTDLGLDVQAVVANDPFFGRVGRMLAVNQREEQLKTEIVVRLYGDDDESGDGTAAISGNCHQDHFGDRFAITTAAGDPAHSACVGFGLERITLGLLRTHGLDPDQWPSEVRDLLRL